MRGLCEKTEGKYFPVQTEQTKLIRLLWYDFWFIFSVFSAVFVFRCSSLPYLREYWFRSMFTTVRHSFSSLINKQLSRKTIIMFLDVLLFDVLLFPTDIPNPLLFLPKSAQKCYRQNVQVRKKAHCSLTSPGRAIRFFPDLSATNQHALRSENKLSHIITRLSCLTYSGLLKKTKINEVVPSNCFTLLFDVESFNKGSLQGNE